MTSAINIALTPPLPGDQPSVFAAKATGLAAQLPELVAAMNAQNADNNAAAALAGSAAAQSVAAADSVSGANLGRLMFAVGSACVFSFTSPNVIGWTNFRFFTPTATSVQDTPRRVANRTAAALTAGQCLYIDLALADTTSDMVVTEATMSTALMTDFTIRKKILLAYNYPTNNLVGVLIPYLLAAENKSAAAPAAAASTNALAARRMIVGAITAISFASTTATVSISEGRVYKENNLGNHEAVIAPLSGASLLINQGIVVDLAAGAVDGSGRIIPTVITVASGSQTGWQSGSKYLLAVNSGAVVHGLYRSTVSQLNAIAARVLVGGRVTQAYWASGAVTVSIAEGRAYKEANLGAVWKTIAPLDNQTLAENECLIVDLAGGSTDGSGRIIPTKLNIAQSSASGWQTADKYILTANVGGSLSGHYIDDSSTAADYATDEVVVVQRSDEVDIYIKGSNPSSNKYLRYRMQRKPDAAISSDVWRINEVWECSRTAEYTFTSLLKLINNGELETAIKQTGKPDFMGGPAHGEEELFSVTMLIDGTVVALGGTGSFRCRRVEFMQGSDLYEVGTTPAKANRLAKNYKRWEFSAAGIELRQRVVWEAAVSLNQTFLCMLPILRTSGAVQVTDTGFRSPLYATEDITDTSFTIVFSTSDIGKVSGPSGYSAEVQVLDGWDKPGRQFFISNSATYNKLYFDFTGAGYTTEVGEVFSARAIFRLDTRN
jgi:hypothetical protein